MEGKGYSTQRVDMDTVDLIKAINLHLRKRNIKLRQSDLIKLAFGFIKSREWDFIEYVETGAVKESSGLFDSIFRATSKPWFPYGNLSG